MLLEYMLKIQYISCYTSITYSTVTVATTVSALCCPNLPLVTWSQVVTACLSPAH